MKPFLKWAGGKYPFASTARPRRGKWGQVFRYHIITKALTPFPQVSVED